MNVTNEKRNMPNLLMAQDKTGETGETATIDFSSVTNKDFITAIFGDLTLERPVFVSFKGNPATVKKNAWVGNAFVKGKSVLQKDANNYLSCSSYTPCEEGRYRRTKAQFAAYHWLLLDDVGVKVTTERVTLAPSWIIETSKDNFQYGYIFAEPLRSATEATNLVDSIIAAGLCDPGANGATARIGRLPVAINGKYPGTVCKLISWQPALKYSLKEVCDGLQIEFKEKTQRKAPNRTIEKKVDHDEVHIPRAADNPVLFSLVQQNIYKQPLGGGKHDITCPWVNDHTGGVDQGTAYWERSESYPIGGFKCLHGHCVDRRVGDLHSFLGITKNEAKHLATIRVTAGEISRIVDVAELELAKTNRHYQRGGIIVTVATDPQTRATNVKALSIPSLTRVVSSLAIWERYDKKANEWLTCDPPEKHVKILHDATAYPHLPILNGMARQPYLRADGSVVAAAGYDAATGMFGVFDARKFNVPASPTRAQAEQAVVKLNGLLSEFSFKSDHDQSAAIAAVLTATLRSSLRLAPMFHVAAPQIASGKSYLCELLTLFATPEKSTPHSFPSEDDEMKKLLLAELLTAPAVVEFDNLTTDLIPHKSLCTALTAENISGRILGQSKTAEVGTRALFLSSGNNVEPVRDMTRRVLTIRLDPQCETPATRDFKMNPVVEVAQNRGEYISAALTVVRAWIVAGRPLASVKPINSYGEWADWCRQPLLWLGMVDPVHCIFDAMAHDPDREYLGFFLKVWFTTYGLHSVTIKNIVDDSLMNSDLRELIVELAAERDGTINKRKLGWWIKRHSGRVVDGLRVVADESYKTKSVMWKLETSIVAVSPVSPVLSGAVGEFGNSEKFLDSELF